MHNLAVSTPAIIWGILSGLSLAFYSLYSKGLLERWSSSVIVGWGMIIGGIGVTIVHFISTKRIYFIINCEICKIKYSTAHHICRHFWDTYCLYLYLDSIRYLTPKRNDIIRLY